MEHGKFYRASEVAKIYGLTTDFVQYLCHARGQKFAKRLTPRGWFYIDIKKFDEFWARLEAKT